MSAWCAGARAAANPLGPHAAGPRVGRCRGGGDEGPRRPGRCSRVRAGGASALSPHSACRHNVSKNSGLRVQIDKPGKACSTPFSWQSSCPEWVRCRAGGRTPRPGLRSVGACPPRSGGERGRRAGGSACPRSSAGEAWRTVSKGCSQRPAAAATRCYRAVRDDRRRTFRGLPDAYAPLAALDDPGARMKESGFERPTAGRSPRRDP